MDVASRAGVSFKTVSRVLNREPHVRPELKRRVEEAVEALGYRPNPAARQLAGRRSYLIAYLFPKANAISYTAAMLVTASAECRDQGYHLVAEPIDVDEDDTAAAVERAIIRLQPDGIVLTPPLSDDVKALAAIERTQIPVARIAGTLDAWGMIVSVDERPVCRKLVRHLLGLGHRRIGLVAPRAEHYVAQGRLQGYLDALKEVGIEPDPALIVPGSFLFHSGVVAADTLLNLALPPTAIFASNDGMALGVMSSAQRRGLRIPQDLAVAGFDDTSAGRMHWPPLTTVRQPFEAMARHAVSLLIGKTVKQPEMVHDLLIRGSTTGSIEFAAELIEA
jgi:LacI family transcriptional regulator